MKKSFVSLFAAALLMVFALPFSGMTALADGWYSTELSGDETVVSITVSLGADANWQLIQQGGYLVSPVTYEFSNGMFYGSYMVNGAGAGSDSIELLFAVDGITYGYCTVNLWVLENGQLEVTGGYANIDSYTGDGGYYPTDDGDYYPTDDGGSSDGSTDTGYYPGSSYYSNFSLYYVIADGLGMYASAYANNAIASYYTGDEVYVGEFIDEWAVVVDGYGNRMGYLPALYVSQQKPGQSTGDSSYDTQQVAVTTYYVIAEGGLLIRELPSTSAAVVDSFAYGTAVSVIKIQDGWATLVDMNNSQWSGYCSAQYLSAAKPSSTSSGGSSSSSSSSNSIPIGVTGISTSDDADDAEGKEEKPWFEMSESGKTLTLRLPVEDQAEWEYVISDEKAFELLTEETTTEDNENIWVASFIATGKKSGNIDLDLSRKLSDKSIDKYYSLEIAVSEDGIMRVIKAEKSWFEIGDNGILTLNLPGNQAEGYTWNEAVADTEIAELVNSTYIEQEDELDDGQVADGYWNGSFRGLKEGETDLTMTYSTDLGTEMTRTLKLSVDSEGKISVKKVEETK